MRFRTKLYTSIGSLLLFITIIVMILMNMLEQSTVKMNVVINELNERIEIASTIKDETSLSSNVLNALLNNREAALNMDLTNAWKNSNSSLQIAIESLEKRDAQEKSQELISKFKSLHESYRNMGEQALMERKINPNAKLSSAFLTDMERTSQRMVQMAELLHGLQEQGLKNELLRSKDTYNWAVENIYIYLVIGLIIGISFAIWIIKSTSNNLNKVTDVMKQAAASDFDTLPRIEISSKGELSEIAVAFNKMAKALEEHSRNEKQVKEDAEELSWLNRQIAKIATLYPEVENVQMLADMLITKLVPMVGASYGVFYLKEVNKSDQYLTRMSSYASLGTEERKQFRLGEGLIGQCALLKRPIHLNEVPEDYLKIGSGLGEASPRTIMVLPVLFEEDVLAVIEIASFETLSPIQIKLLEKVNNNLGIKINSIINHMKVEQLLQESQALTEELQAQSEELQMQQEELRTTNEKLEEQYEASKQHNFEIQEVSAALEEKAQQLELSSKYKTEFLANMSHELRTPLNSLLILAQILSENGEGNLTYKQQEYIKTIYSSGNDLLNLINDILDLAKVESGKLDVISKEVELNQLRDIIYRQFSPIANKKKVHFSIELDKALPMTIITDEQRLQQIVKNLLANAFKFTESGSVSLQINSVMKNITGNKGDEQRLERMFAFSVIDTGIGIEEEKQESIFDAFKQADGTTSRKYGGTGLGLSICRELAQLLGGFIEVTSEIRNGSTFTLYLPNRQMNNNIVNISTARTEAAVSMEANYLVNNDDQVLKEGSMLKHGKSILKNKKILIVDDDIRNVYALTIALENYDMEILVAENGREALQVLQEHPNTDLILMDIMMPEMDGFEAIQHIRRINIFETIPIIALTAKAMKHSREECLQAGATDYISKPINLEQLFSLMQVWLFTKEG
ncbi:two-component system chemotaxis sensor kinase CheA [Neobacillus niacini]|uniref:response regulator n=1 Tax=Neobacillus driksii TaxID=3035913 RepID=UPI0027890DAD|nr:response regulator [Neobacillus niacini]MDQ0971546.1 two-component system chemotaxis sensor kinase CheA [Neobacillus niacini]